MNPDQQKALAALAEVWLLSPDVRLGQLMAHLGFLGEAHLGRGLGYIDDDELVSVLCRHRDELVSRTQGAAPQSMASTPATPSAAVAPSLPQVTATEFGR